MKAPMTLGAEDVEVLRQELERRAAELAPPRWNPDPEDVRRSVAKLVLTLIDFVRQLLERQVLRRMDEGSLTDVETENLGIALMRLEETVHELAKRFDIPPEDLKLGLGPLGRLT
jgi:hypothetical protein